MTDSPSSPSSRLSRLDHPAPPDPRLLLSAVAKARRLRDRSLPAELFGEPAWDMLLDLTIADMAGRPTLVTGLTASSGAPMSTALRYIALMEKAGLLSRHDDPRDRRRVLLRLMPDAREAMERWVQDCADLGLLGPASAPASPLPAARHGDRARA